MNKEEEVDNRLGPKTEYKPQKVTKDAVKMKFCFTNLARLHKTDHECIVHSNVMIPRHALR